jgi:hypothetical protein
VIFGIVGLLVLYSVIYATMAGNLMDFNSIPRGLEALFIIMLAGYVFYETAVTGDSTDPFKSGIFIINGGVMFYFTASFIIFIFSKYSSMQDLMIMYSCHSVVNAFCNIVYAVGLWKLTSQSYSPAS